MLVEGLLLGSVISTFYKIDRSMKMDERALKEYAEAYEIQALARKKLEDKSMETDRRLNNVVKKKRNALEHSIPKFIEMYEVIQEVIVNSRLKELPEMPQQVVVSNIKKTITAKQLSDKELICTWIFRGIGGVAVKDSERYLSAANSQLDYSNAYQTQTESIMEFYDAIIKQADLLSETIAKVNCLLINSLPRIEKIIRDSEGNIKNFSNQDTKKMMVCANIACALAALISVPVIDEKGIIYEEGVKMIAKGQNELMKLESAVKSF